jgi:hypothetical protein
MTPPNTDFIDPKETKLPEIFLPRQVPFKPLAIDLFDRPPVQSQVLCHVPDRHPATQIHHIVLQ